MGCANSVARADTTEPGSCFEFQRRFMSEEARLEILGKAQLGADPSSQHFAERLKAIRFLMVIDGIVQCFTQDYFVQDQTYNDFSGGLKRRYKLVPDELLQGPLADMIFVFTRHFLIPERTVLLLQIQKTTFRQSSRRESITGQGIHTDGADRAAILCLHRGNGVVGSLNQYHAKLDGSRPLCEPTALEPGDISFFKDNEIFHYVTPGSCLPGSSGGDCERTIVIIHSPACQYLTGRANLQNTLGTNASAVQLRQHAEDLSYAGENS